MWIILDLDDFQCVTVVVDRETGNTISFTRRKDAKEYADTFCAVYQLVKLEEELD